MAKNNNVPQCTHCFGRNWIDLGAILDPTDCNEDRDTEYHLYQCGGGVAHSDPEDMKQGCMRVIRATPADMQKEGVI